MRAMSSSTFDTWWKSSRQTAVAHGPRAIRGQDASEPVEEERHVAADRPGDLANAPTSHLPAADFPRLANLVGPIDVLERLHAGLAKPTQVVVARGQRRAKKTFADVEHALLRRFIQGFVAREPGTDGKTS